MANTIKIKRSTSTATPSDGSLSAGELAYSSSSNKLFVGHPDGSTQAPQVIGGKLYTDMLDHTAGTLTASSAIIVDSSSKIDVLNVDNITINGNAITSTNTNGDITITPNGTGDIVLDGQNWPQADGSANQYLKTNGSGQLSWAAIPSGSFTISDNQSTPNTDTFSTGDTLTFEGSTGITTTVSDDNVAIAITAGGVGTTQLASDAVTGAKIADNAIDSEHYTDGSIDTAHIGDLQVTSGKLAASAVATAKIADLAVTTGKIAASAVTNAKMAANSVDSDQYVDGSIDTAHIGDDQVTQAKIAAGAVDTTELAADAVTGAKLADDAVDSEHITDGAVDNVHLAGSIANAKLANSSVTVGSTSISLGATATTVDGLNTVHGIDGSGTDAAGTDLTIKAGGGTGTGAGGEILFQVADGGSTGSSVNTFATALTIADDGDITAAQNFTVSGNLTVSGTTTTVNSETVTFDDNILVLNNNYSGGSPTENAGIEVERGTVANVALRWNETSDKWQITEDGSAYKNIIHADSDVDGGTF